MDYNLHDSMLTFAYVTDVICFTTTITTTITTTTFSTPHSTLTTTTQSNPLSPLSTPLTPYQLSVRVKATSS